ncbi:MAG: hypothetical protein LBR73_07185 [Oscillospiraceae bacterium]|jgi:YbbR domain-containing protein|nr:hypothetical protein [Oscillospiraceae bacterium]
MRTAPKPTSRLQRILQNNYILLVLSAAIAFLVWIILVLNVGGADEENTIRKVPVEINFSGTVAERLQLQAFWLKEAVQPEDITVDVTVKGRRYDISDAVLKPEDFTATLVSRDVSTAGDYQLEISVASKNPLDRDKYEILDISPKTVSVYFDYVKEKTFPLTVRREGQYSVPEGFVTEAPILSQTSVTISGPAKEMNAIAGVLARFQTEGEYKETTLVKDVEIVPVNAFDDNEFRYLTIEGGEAHVNATIPVLKRATVQPIVQWANVPTAYSKGPPSVTITPSVLDVAMPEGMLDDTNRLIIGTVDFAKLDPAHNTFTFKPGQDLLADVRFLADTKEVKASVNLEGYSTKTVTLSASACTASADGYRVTSSVRRVTVVGPPAALDTVTSDSVKGIADVSAVAEDAESASVPVAIQLPRPDCWVYGSYETKVVKE